jgi:hypothetical protein
MERVMERVFLEIVATATQSNIVDLWSFPKDIPGLS